MQDVRQGVRRSDLVQEILQRRLPPEGLQEAEEGEAAETSGLKVDRGKHAYRIILILGSGRIRNVRKLA
jgi:hypothetical protein